MVYDGIDWRATVLNERPPVRQIKKNSKNQILVSYSRSFGELVSDNKGSIKYKEIVRMPKGSPYGISELSNNQYLITTFSNLILLDGKELQIINKEKVKIVRVNHVDVINYLSD